MQKNIGTIDRVLRLIVGISLLIWVLVFGGPVWAYIGFVPLATALFRWCPLYSLIDIKSSN